MRRRLGINKNKMNKCCKKCDYEFSIWGEPVARGCNDLNCECHKKMTNKPWQERFDKVYYNHEFYEKGETRSKIIDFISELLQEEREGIKRNIMADIEKGFTAGYKAGREEILKWVKERKKKKYDHIPCPDKRDGCIVNHYIVELTPEHLAYNEALEELQNLINKDEK